jgi:hypothetical protein
MVRFANRALALSGLALSLAAIVPGCTADVQSMMYVRQVQGLVAPQCVVDNSPESVAISGGTLDIAFRTEYVANLLVGNQLVGRGAPELSRTETSNIQLRSAVVRVENSAGQQLSAYTIPVNGFVEASRAGAVSYGIVAVPLVDTTAALAAGTEKGPRRLFSRVRVIGETLGGSEVESAEFGFPITVCNGCLVSFPADSDDPAIDGPDCDAVAASAVTAAQCIFGQDAAVDCRQCRGTDVCKP